MGDKPRKWNGSDDEGYEWLIECETDCFKGGEPFVVSLDIQCSEGDGLAMLTAEQARELAAALIEEADLTDANNKRIGLGP